MKQPNYNIGDTVYHRTPNSDQGMVIDVLFSYAQDEHTYLIAVGWGGEFICKEYEITDSKIY